MKIISNLYDYMYYRLGKLYYKTEGRGDILPISIIALSQMLIFMDVVFLIFSLFGERLAGRKFVHQNFQLIVILISIVSILLLIFNYKKYNHKFGELCEKWKDEPKHLRNLRGLLIFVFLIFITFFDAILNKIFS